MAVHLLDQRGAHHAVDGTLVRCASVRPPPRTTPGCRPHLRRAVVIGRMNQLCRRRSSQCLPVAGSCCAADAAAVIWRPGAGRRRSAGADRPVRWGRIRSARVQDAGVVVDGSRRSDQFRRWRPGRSGVDGTVMLAGWVRWTRRRLGSTYRLRQAPLRFLSPAPTATDAIARRTYVEHNVFMCVTLGFPRRSSEEAVSQQLPEPALHAFACLSPASLIFLSLES